MSKKLIDVFKGEARELVHELERALLVLDSDRSQQDAIGAVFRAMHTLKGSAGMFGYEDIQALTHELENIYQDIRDNVRSLDEEILKVTFRTLDHLRHSLQESNSLTKANADNELLRDINAISRKTNPTVGERPGARGKLTTYFIDIRPGKDILRTGNNPIYLIDDLASLGRATTLPYLSGLPSLGDLDPIDSYLHFVVILASEKSQDEIRDVFIFVEGQCNVQIQVLSNGDMLQDTNTLTSLRAHHTLEKPVTFASAKEVLSRQSQQVLQTKTKSKAIVQSSIRVASERLDDLMSLVSELVTTQARLSLYADLHPTAELSVISENIEKITGRLRDNAFSMSLVPLENLVVRFQRLVRDLSKDLGKEIEFKTEGMETEIDKSLVDQITDPLLHILRNCIDHGIEKTEDRLKNGKPAKGRVTMRAYYSGAKVQIEISDDGGGIDLDKVRQKAITRNLVQEDSILSERALLDLIFLPGFSTATQVTGVSGRGVGMDVVRKNIDHIRGDIEVKTSRGQGTTFLISLPVTLSILDGLLVSIGSDHFIFPIAFVGQCHEIPASALTSFNQWTTLNGKRVPFFNLHTEFEMHKSAPELFQVIEIPYNDTTIGLAVDRIEGKYSAVLKPLGKYYDSQDEFSGATILGDGSVALVVDPVKLIRKFTIENKSHVS